MQQIKNALKYLLAVSFILAGPNHFRSHEFYMRMMPPYLPWHLFLVLLSGVVESVLGILLLVLRIQHVVAWGLIGLLWAMFPANVHMALHPDLFSEFSPPRLWARLPLQAALIAWSNWYTRNPSYTMGGSSTIDVGPANSVGNLQGNPVER